MMTATMILVALVAVMAIGGYLSMKKEYNFANREIGWLRSRVDSIAQAHSGLNDKVTEIDGVLAKHVEAAGFIWKTASGYVVTVKQMSTNHLRNTLSMFRARRHQEPFVSMQRELDRRKEDADWEAKTAWKYESQDQEPITRHRGMPLAGDKSRRLLEELDLWLIRRSRHNDNTMIRTKSLRDKLAELADD